MSTIRFSFLMLKVFYLNRMKLNLTFKLLYANPLSVYNNTFSIFSCLSRMVLLDQCPTVLSSTDFELKAGKGRVII